MSDAVDRTGTELRAYRRRRAREEVRSTALRLFGARGFDEVTVEDIATQAHISQRTFFRYYASKEDLVFDREMYFMVLGDLLRERPAEEAPEVALKRAWVETFTLFESDRRGLAAVHKIVKKDPKLLSRATGLLFVSMDPIVDIMAERMGVTADSDFRPMVLIANALVISMAVIRMWSLDGEESLPSLFDRFSDPSDLKRMLTKYHPTAANVSS